jgi:hypothetical protein
VTDQRERIAVSDDDKLTEAFHVLFDVKDAHYANEEVRIVLASAIRHTKAAMRLLGVDVPVRSDQPAK